jgi:hypothetical protein
MLRLHRPLPDFRAKRRRKPSFGHLQENLALSITAGGSGPLVCTENLDTDVVVMKSAKDRV